VSSRHPPCPQDTPRVFKTPPVSSRHPACLQDTPRVLTHPVTSNRPRPHTDIDTDADADLDTDADKDADVDRSRGVSTSRALLKASTLVKCAHSTKVKVNKVRWEQNNVGSEENDGGMSCYAHFCVITKWRDTSRRLGHMRQPSGHMRESVSLLAFSYCF
jgi:hypothetical protein